ncbi:MAG: L-histidine N(alpha)-methyltransferase, partial [Alphaproteobacteria bacterium]
MESAAFGFHDLAPPEESFRDAVFAGLSREPKSLPCKFFYDARGSALFERICQVPEYYLTRTEIAILERYAGDIAERIGPHCRLFELGSGASVKVRILLRALRAPAAYVPIDISRESLR